MIPKPLNYVRGANYSRFRLYVILIYTSGQETRHHRIKICTYEHRMILLDSFVLKGTYKGGKRVTN